MSRPLPADRPSLPPGRDRVALAPNRWLPSSSPIISARAQLLIRLPMLLAISGRRLHTRPRESPDSRPKAAPRVLLPMRQRAPAAASPVGSSSSTASTLPLVLFHTGSMAGSRLDGAWSLACACAPAGTPRARARRSGNWKRRMFMARSRLPTPWWRPLAGIGMLFGLCLFNKSRISPKRYCNLSGASIPTNGRARSSATSHSLKR